MSDTLSECLRLARSAAKRAAAWAEVTDLFPHHARVAKTFAREAQQAAHDAATLAKTATSLAPAPARAKSAEAQRALADAERTRTYAEQAAESAAHAAESAKAARRFVPPTGDLADLCRTRQHAVFAWLSCPEGDVVKLAMLRAQMEEAEAAVQAALPVPVAS